MLHNDCMPHIDRPLLRYFGGKWSLRHWILENLPAHRTYAEPFGGGASILLSKAPAPDGEIINDLDDELINLYRVVQSRDSFAELEHRLQWTPYAEAELDLARNNSDGLDAVDRARRVLIASWMYLPVYGSDHSRRSSWRMEWRSRCGVSKPRNLARSWNEWKGVLKAIHARLSTVAISRRDALDFIHSVDEDGRLLFVDPPYMKDTRGKHRYLFDSVDHDLLVHALLASHCKVVLSGYKHAVYEPLESAGWIRLEHAARANLSEEPRTECLWISPQAQGKGH